jgi:uncharacterized protein with ParB-like and HNH nuclease domain
MANLEITLDGEEEDEELSDENVVYQINTFGADYDVSGLVKRFENGTIYKPTFQRDFVWTLKQSSRFIESIILGLPIPSIFLYKEERTQKQLIVDGLQRLTTLSAFKKGTFEHNDKKFRLQKVRKQLLNKTIDDLDPADRLRFEDAVIHCMIIQQMTPDDDNSSVYHIFDRLNSNSTPLQPQEIRSAIYHGKFQEFLESANANKSWRAIFGKEHRRAKDKELILRFLALFFNEKKYAKPMKEFLNSFMRKYRDTTNEKLENFQDIFETTIERVRAAIGDGAFRPQRVFNVAVFDAIMVAVAHEPTASSSNIKYAVEQLYENPDFMKMCRDATSDELVVSGRLKIAKAYLNDAIRGR